MNSSQTRNISNQNLNTGELNPLSPRTTERDITGYRAGNHSVATGVPAPNTFINNFCHDNELNAVLQHLSEATPERFRSGSTHVEIVQSATTFIRSLTETIQTFTETIQTFTETAKSHPRMDIESSQSSNAASLPTHNTATTRLVTSLHSDSTKSSSEHIEKIETDKILSRTANQNTLNDTMKIIQPADRKTSENERKMHHSSFLTRLRQQTPTVAACLKRLPEDIPKDDTPSTKKSKKEKAASRMRDQNRKTSEHFDKIKNLLHLKEPTKVNILKAANRHICLCQRDHQKIQLGNTSTTLPDKQEEPSQVLNHPQSSLQNTRNCHYKDNASSDIDKKVAHAQAEKSRREEARKEFSKLQSTVTRDPRSTIPPSNFSYAKEQILTESIGLIENCIKKHAPELGYTNIHQYQSFYFAQWANPLSSDPNSQVGSSSASCSETATSLSKYPDNSPTPSDPTSYNSTYSSEDLPTAGNSPNRSRSHVESKTALSPFSNWWIQEESSWMQQEESSWIQEESSWIQEEFQHLASSNNT